MQTNEKFCKVFALKFSSFLCPQTCSALFVGRASTFIIYHPINIYCFAYLLKTTISKSRFTSIRDT